MNKDSMKSFSREGLESVIEMWEEGRRENAAIYREDPLKFLQIMPYTLDPHGVKDDPEAAKIMDKQLAYMKEASIDYTVADKISCLTNEHGIAKEAVGYRKGFAMAMRLCMQAMAEGLY